MGNRLSNRLVWTVALGLFLSVGAAWGADGVVPERGVQKVIEGVGELGELQKPYPPAPKYIDLSYLREAQKRVFGR